ncbi:MAG: porin family protein [Vicinamibacteria bacterium]|nr:porin family protein [Vicinamibacteria bacterium]
MIRRQIQRGLFLGGGLLVTGTLAWPVPVAAQTPSVSAVQMAGTTVVRTTRDRVLVWARDPSRVIATLPEGVGLDALSRDAQWVEVRLPETFRGPGEQRGFVFGGHVALVSGPALSTLPGRSTTAAQGAGATVPRPRRSAPRFGIRGYGEGAYQWFTAADSFKAILDTSGGLFYGGGAQVHFGPIYVDVGVSRFEKTGERAFVFEGDVFRLGIPDRITMTPVVVTAGYRFPIRDRIVPYVGGGVGSLKFEERSDFADPGENVSERFTSYHAVAGVEYAATRWLFVAGEVRYAAVPDALGAPGIAADFDESNLGGVSVAVKVLVGR